MVETGMVSVRIEGLSESQEKLLHFESREQVAAGNAMESWVMGKVLPASVVGAPKKTGALAKSLWARALDASRLLWAIGDGVRYGVFQEFGFSHAISGKFVQNPFVVPAIKGNSIFLEEALREEFKALKI